MLNQRLGEIGGHGRDQTSVVHEAAEGENPTPTETVYRTQGVDSLLISFVGATFSATVSTIGSFMVGNGATAGGTRDESDSDGGVGVDLGNVADDAELDDESMATRKNDWEAAASTAGTQMQDQTSSLRGSTVEEEQARTGNATDMDENTSTWVPPKRLGSAPRLEELANGAADTKQNGVFPRFTSARRRSSTSNKQDENRERRREHLDSLPWEWAAPSDGERGKFDVARSLQVGVYSRLRYLARLFINPRT